jgi:hypothetical protein
MKLSEFKKIEEQRQQDKQQLDELSLSSFIGDVGSAAVKSMFSGKGFKQQMLQDIFLKDFYDDAYTSLDNALKGGLVSTDIKGSLTGSKQVDPTDIDPTGDAAPATSKTAGAVAGQKAQQQTTQTINNYVKGAAQAINQTTDKNQKIALIKELVNSMADRQGSPEWDNAFKGVEGIIKRAGADPNFANAAINNLKAGKTMAEAYQIYFINKLIESVGLTWKDVGLCVITENKKYYIAETKFIKLNQLFESILEASSGQQSISEYMLDWFNMYMTGVPWRSKEAMVLPMIQAIEDSYPQGYKDAIKTLARTAFALSKSLTAMPKGMQDELANMKKDAPAKAEKPEDVAGAIENLAKTNPKAYNDLVRKLKPV